MTAWREIGCPPTGNFRVRGPGDLLSAYREKPLSVDNSETASLEIRLERIFEDRNDDV